MNAPAALTNEELLREVSHYRREAQALREWVALKEKGGTSPKDVELQLRNKDALYFDGLAQALEELHGLRTGAAELKSDPNLTGELAQTPPPNGG